MRMILVALLQALSMRFRQRASLELEIIALRHELKILKRSRSVRTYKRWITPDDRFFFVLLYRLWPQAINIIRLVKPVTLVQWHHYGFRLYWGYRSRSKGPPKIKMEIQELVLRLHRDNPLWGAGRIHGELVRLGYHLSAQTVLRYLNEFRAGPLPPSPTWRTFLRNHLHEAVSVDCLVVITATYQFLYAFIVLGLHRRKILHFEVTAQPNQTWISNQISKALQNRPRPRFLLRDRDALYGGTFENRLKRMRVENVVAAPHAPWHNNYVERVILSIRQECLNHVIIFNEHHLRRILGAYVNYYNKTRTHEALGEDCPDHRPIQQRYEGKKIVAIPEVGGLHHRYERRRAA